MDFLDADKKDESLFMPVAALQQRVQRILDQLNTIKKVDTEVEVQNR